MRSITSCYNEHAVRVYDSYCSRPSSQAYLCPKLSPSASSPDSVTCIYKVTLSTQTQPLVTLTWTKKLTGQGFTISITTDSNSSSKSNAHPQQMRKNKGAEIFQSCNFKVRVLWDLSAARYDRGPEPVSGFFVVVLMDSEVGLHIGDRDEELSNMKDLKAGKSMAKFSMVSRSEVFGSRAIYSTKAQFSEAGTAHDLLIKCDAEEEGCKGDALCVYIDKKKILQVKRLKWNFRGNQAVFVDGLVVDMMWDVHDWVFKPKAASAVFMFRTRSGANNRLWLEEKLLEKQTIGFSFFIYARDTPH